MDESWFSEELEIPAFHLQLKAQPEPLTLPEEFFCLAIEDMTGKLIEGEKNNFGFGLAGCLLASLTLQDKVFLNDSGQLQAQDSYTTENELFGDLAALHPGDVACWLTQFAAAWRDYTMRLATLLQSREVLIIQEKYYLWTIPYRLFPEAGATMKFWVKKRLREAALASAKPESQTLALLAILRAARMLDLAFTHDECHAVGRHIEVMVATGCFKSEWKQVFQALQTAADLFLTSPVKPLD